MYLLCDRIIEVAVRRGSTVDTIIVHLYMIKLYMIKNYYTINNIIPQIQIVQLKYRISTT